MTIIFDKLIYFGGAERVLFHINEALNPKDIVVLFDNKNNAWKNILINTRQPKWGWIFSKRSIFILFYPIICALSTTFNLIMCALFNVYVFYLQGPSVWPIEIVRKMNISSKGIAYASEVNIKLLHSGLKFIEIAGYCNLGSESSTSFKFSSFIDIFKTIFHLLYEIKVKKNYKTKSERIN